MAASGREGCCSLEDHGCCNGCPGFVMIVIIFMWIIIIIWWVMINVEGTVHHLPEKRPGRPASLTNPGMKADVGGDQPENVGGPHYQGHQEHQGPQVINQGHQPNIPGAAGGQNLTLCQTRRGLRHVLTRGGLAGDVWNRIAWVRTSNLLLPSPHISSKCFSVNSVDIRRCHFNPISLSCILPHHPSQLF